jgi:hypothetical protein
VWQCWAISLAAVNDAGPKGIATYDLLHKLGSTHHAKAFIERAEKEGLDKMKSRKSSNIRPICAGL